MQQIHLPKAACRGVRVDVHRPPEAVERHRRIRLHERLRAGGCSEALAMEAAGTPRSTLFRWRRAPALPQPCQAPPVLEHANPNGVPSIPADGRPVPVLC